MYTVYSGKFEVKEKKNNPKLAVNIRPDKKIYLFSDLRIAPDLNFFLFLIL